MTQYFVIQDGRITNVVLTSKPKSEVAALFRDHVTVKTEDECTQAELEAYEFWATRP